MKLFYKTIKYSLLIIGVTGLFSINFVFYDKKVKAKSNSVIIENSIESSSNTGNKSDNNIETGKAESKSKVEIKVEENSEGKIKVESKARANDAESQTNLNENLQDLPLDFQKRDSQQKNNSEAKSEINIKQENFSDSDTKKQSGVQNEDSAEEDRSEELFKENKNKTSYFNNLKDNWLLFFEKLSSKVNSFFG
jgi:hypothetical protein